MSYREFFGFLVPVGGQGKELANLQITEATVRKRKSSALRNVGLATGTKVRTPWYSHIGDDFPETFLARIETDFQLTSGVVTDLVVETGQGLSQFQVPTHVPVWEGDQVRMIVGDGRVLAVVNPRLGKVFETGYELVPLGAIERVPLVSFVASVIGMIMSGFLAWALCAMALHKWTTIFFWIEMVPAVMFGIMALAALPLWYWTVIKPRLRRFKYEQQVDRAIRQALWAGSTPF